MKTAAEIELKIEMLRRGLTRHDLAKITDLAPASISFILSGFIRSRESLLLWRIEKAMGAPFWSDPEEFRQRMALVKAAGFDPWLERKAKLVRACRRDGLIAHDAVGKDLISKDDLIAMLAAHYKTRERA